jgi:hypothetical protein
MPLWTKTKPPVFAPQSKATPQGWKDPQTGEVYVAIQQLSSKAGPATIRSVIMPESVLEETAFEIEVVFSEAVNVEAGAELILNNSDGPDLTMTASEQSNATRVIFAAMAPVFPGTLSMPAQTIDGDVKDADLQELDADIEITAAVALAAGEIVIEEDEED